MSQRAAMSMSEQIAQQAAQQAAQQPGMMQQPPGMMRQPGMMQQLGMPHLAGTQSPAHDDPELAKPLGVGAVGSKRMMAMTDAMQRNGYISGQGGPDQFQMTHTGEVGEEGMGDSAMFAQTVADSLAAHDRALRQGQQKGQSAMSAQDVAESLKAYEQAMM